MVTAMIMTNGLLLLQVCYGHLATVTPCGSKVTCDPYPEDSDSDYLCLVDGRSDLSKLVDLLTSDNWEWEGDGEHYQDTAANTFMSWRRGHDNLIVTTNEYFAAKHGLATRVCKYLNLMDKKQRVAIFQAVLYNNYTLMEGNK
jgi:hypothetical protein